MNFKNIHIGNLIQQKVKEDQIEMLRICNFMKRS
ncbi:MAG: transposase, partial [Chryseobacterium sp.]|nr:transposase [Chryseobacterium sp.]